MNTNMELCAKCVGSGETIDRKRRVKICTLCGGMGKTPEINNSAFVNEHLYEQ